MYAFWCKIKAYVIAGVEYIGRFGFGADDLIAYFNLIDNFIAKHLADNDLAANIASTVIGGKQNILRADTKDD